jgi:hypothetical protein
MIYPDLAILLSLLVPGENTAEASSLLRGPDSVPLAISIVHRLQVENSLLRYLHGRDESMRKIANQGLLLWRRYVEEGVFEIRSFPLDLAFAQAAAWNAESIHQPPSWQMLAHVALAASAKAQFMSLNPALRNRAAKAGLSLIPARL